MFKKFTFCMRIFFLVYINQFNITIYVLYFFSYVKYEGFMCKVFSEEEPFVMDGLSLRLYPYLPSGKKTTVVL